MTSFKSSLGSFNDRNLLKLFTKQRKLSVESFIVAIEKHSESLRALQFYL